MSRHLREPGRGPVLLFVSCAVAALASLIGFAETPPQPPMLPIRAFGQVLATDCKELEVVLTTASGTSEPQVAVATLMKIRTGETEATYYQAEWPGEVRSAFDNSHRLRLWFEVDGSRRRSPLELDSVPTGILMAHVDKDGNPLTPADRVIAAWVAQPYKRPTQVVLTAVIAHFADTRAEGALSFAPEAATTPAFKLGCNLPERRVSVRRQNLTVEAGTALPRVWTATWVGKDASTPCLFRRFEAIIQRDSLVDKIGRANDSSEGAPLPDDAPELKRGSGGMLLESRGVTISAGTYLSVALESSLSASEARAALTTWALTAPARQETVESAFSMSRVDIHDLPGGGSWVAGRFLSSGPRTLDRPMLRPLQESTPTTVLPGSWKLRQFQLFERVEPTQSY
ncbi:MAG: hypothetical protein HY815_26725 [Candidatus Riflebacteria bacterium]|nr:hypothetical protein [Candidatus Riflebacteria bacterium]